MIGPLQPLILSTAILGVAIYGLTQSGKKLLPQDWRNDTKLGQFTLTVLPLALGVILCLLALNELATYLSHLVGYKEAVVVPLGARLLLGLFSGTLATQIHSLVRKKIASKKEEIE
tara:strand:+ start:5347 stop:5694 length:348 start_codon:yes stop_codon:yes gene_type:complete